MTDYSIDFPSAVDGARRTFARHHARWICEQLDRPESEKWLSGELEKTLKDYSDGVERMAKDFEKMALQAFNIAPMKPFLVKK